MNPNPYVLKSAADTAYANVALISLICLALIFAIARIRLGRRKR